MLIDSLQQVLHQPEFKSLYFWSEPASGRTHLLHAACSELANLGQSVCYIPLEQYSILSTDIFEGLENSALVCLDNIDAIVGIKSWEIAIFDLFNRLYESQKTSLLITASLPPSQLHFSLPDLKSRLEWGQIYHLHSLNDEEKLIALQLRASSRGFELPDEVGHYLLNRLSRDMRSLFAILDKLDIATITEKRKLTVPFVKNIFNL